MDQRKRGIQRNKAGYTAIQSRTVGQEQQCKKLLGIQKCDGPTDRPTDTARCRVACPRLKIKWFELEIYAWRHFAKYWSHHDKVLR